MKSRFMIAATLSVALAVGAPLANALMTAQKFRDYPSFRVKIEPYDPRDLFYGHYLRFQTTWNWKDKTPENNQFHGSREACLCVGEGDTNPVVSAASCPPAGENLPNCRFTLRGTLYGNSRFDTGVNRYYVDEALAKPLEDLFVREKRDFSLDLHVTPEGKTLPGELYVEGERLKDFVARHGGRIPEGQKQ